MTVITPIGISSAGVKALWQTGDGFINNIIFDDSDNMFIPSGGALRLGGDTGPFELLHLSDGNLFMEGSGEVGFLAKRLIDNDGTAGPLGTRTNPIFIDKRISQAGDGDFEVKTLFQADEEAERVIIKWDSKGILSTIAVDGLLGRSLEGYKQDGDVNPWYAINSEGSESRLELGPGADDDVDTAITRTGTQELSLQVGANSTSLASKLTVYGDTIVIQSGVGLMVNGLPAEYMLAKVESIDATAIATTQLLDIPVGKGILITKVVIAVTAFATAGVVYPKIGIGVNAGADDIFYSTELTGLNGVNDIWVFNSFGKSIINPAGSDDPTLLGVDVASDAGTMTITAYVFGCLI